MTRQKSQKSKGELGACGNTGVQGEQWFEREQKPQLMMLKGWVRCKWKNLHLKVIADLERSSSVNGRGRHQVGRG